MASAQEKTFVVTGASTGIGRATVDKLVRDGHPVWATVRTSQDEAALTADHGSAVRVLRFDLRDAEAIRAAGTTVSSMGPIHGLVNNAGAALPGPLEYLSIERFRQQIEINLIGQLAVTQAMLPALRRARRQGDPARIVTIGSIGDRIAAPMLGAYHASKFGLVGLTDTLRAELAPAGIDVILIEPGGVATPIWSRGTADSNELIAALPETAKKYYSAQIAGALTNAKRGAEQGIPASRVADVIVSALLERRPRTRRLVGTDAKIAGLIARLPFGLRYRLTAARA
jgi:NAD(P)-dependent dehydrogenase (short-subunit alcohol dehydrogenase family)